MAETLEAEPAGEQTLNPASEPAPEDAAAMEVAEKKLARQRDREVRTILKKLLDELIESYASDGHGIEIREIVLQRKSGGKSGEYRRAKK